MRIFFIFLLSLACITAWAQDDGAEGADSLAIHGKEHYLDEVTVKGRAMRMTSKGRVYYPSSAIAGNVGDALTLIASLNMPLLSVIPSSQTVRYWGKGSVKYYINEVEAEVRQIQALRSDAVRKVEYINRPDLEYGSDVGLVIKITTNAFEQGMQGSIALNKALNRNNGSADMEARLNSGNSELLIDAKASYTDSKSHFDRDATSETFNLADRVFQRQEEQTGGKTKENDICLGLAYHLSLPDKGKLVIRSKVTNDVTPLESQLSNLHNLGMMNDTTYKSAVSDGHRLTMSSNINYRRTIGDRSVMMLDLFHYYLRHNGSREYSETTPTAMVFSSYTHTSGMSQGIRLRGVYLRQLTGKLNWQSSISAYGTHHSNSYEEETDDKSVIDRNVVSATSGLFLSIGSLTSNFKFSVDHSRTSIDGMPAHSAVEPGVTAGINWMFDPDKSVGLDFGYRTARPSQEDLSTASQVIDALQYRTGNPDLKDMQAFSADLESSLDFGILGLEMYSYNELCRNSIQERSFLDGSIIRRMPDNFDYVAASKNGVVASLHFPEWLRMSVGIGYNYFQSKDKVGRKLHYGKGWIRTSVTATVGKWLLQGAFWTHNNDFYGEVLETSGRMMSLSVARTWLNDNLTTSLSVSNPFSKDFSKQGVVNHSAIAPYSNWTYSDYTHRMVMFNLAYKFSTGRKGKAAAWQDIPEISDGQISSRKSAEVK